ncbi:undecaprenyl-diphosphate phosphatase [Jannaschia sp. R86511]|uniref:undecaprenyl-diphosphate phosphatase n=1 Tax=Jannaschia sp. R86511 TaxID=3093853 RepID=UPI0036D2D2E0
MSWLTAVVLGLVQGLTEFLPVSSSAHVSVVGQLLGNADPGAAFTAITQLGTEAAVVVYFRRDIVRIAGAWLLAMRGKVPHSHPDARIGWLVIVGSLPIGLLGFALQDTIEGPAVRSLWVTATMLWVFAVVLHLADRRARTVRSLEDLTWRHGIIFGLAQALALVPGVSRSGGTIAAGLFLGYTRESAARYSFLLAIPAVLASGGLQVVKSLGDAGSAADPTFAWGPTLVATAIAGVVGYAVIAWLLRYLSTHTFTPFVAYRIAAAAVIYALLGTGVLMAGT